MTCLPQTHAHQQRRSGSLVGTAPFRITATAAQMGSHLGLAHSKEVSAVASSQKALGIQHQRLVGARLQGLRSTRGTHPESALCNA